MIHFPSDKRLQGLADWLASGAGRNSPSWGDSRLPGDTPWHGQASPGGSPCSGSGTQPRLSQAIGPLCSLLMDRGLLEGHSLLVEEAPSWPCSQGARGSEDDAFRRCSFSTWWGVGVSGISKSGMGDCDQRRGATRPPPSLREPSCGLSWHVLSCNTEFPSSGWKPF